MAGGGPSLLVLVDSPSGNGFTVLVVGLSDVLSVVLDDKSGICSAELPVFVAVQDPDIIVSTKHTIDISGSLRFEALSSQF